MTDDSLSTDALLELYPAKTDVRCIVKYSGHFKGFNATISYRTSLWNKELTFSLSRQWETVGDDIKRGLLQHLILRLFRRKETPALDTTESVKLYLSFMKNIERFAPVTKSDPVLLASFSRVNMQFFDGLMEQPNLVVGDSAFRKLGHFEYQTDTVVIAPVIIDNQRLLDYVMYHELLHKKHRFYASATGKRMHHHAAFRHDEEKFPQFELIDRQISAHLTKNKKKWFEWFLE